MSNFDVKAIVTDPLSKFGGANKANPHLIEACGLLPWMALTGPGPLAKNLELNYHFFNGWRRGAETVELDGTYSYPEDPDMYPLMQITATTEEGLQEIIYLYQYAMVAHFLDGELVGVSRMD